MDLPEGAGDPPEDMLRVLVPGKDWVEGVLDELRDYVDVLRSRYQCG